MEQLSLTAIETSPAPTDLKKPTEPKIFSVSDLNRAIRGTLEGGFPLVWLKGEISNFKPHTSGHWYFTLKDNKAQVSAVMFRGFNQSVRFRPGDGLEVMVRGKVTVYEPRGNYQIFCELMEPVGAGALQLAFEQLKAKLEAEGLFSEERKRALPPFPRHVGVVTSPTGAAIRDILKVLQRRFRGIRVTLVPAVVQGEQAPASIVNAIALVNRLNDVDVLIVGRGGGSLEDLCCFNDERVVRALAASRIPTISAVGHEIDFTIADFVADVRAPTPSAAAEMVVKSATELRERLEFQHSRLLRVIKHRVELWRRQIDLNQQRLVDPKKRLADLAQRCDELQGRLSLASQHDLEKRRHRVLLLEQRLGSPLDQLTRRRHLVGESWLRLQARAQLQMERCKSKVTGISAALDHLSPLKVLDRGYAIASLDHQVLRDPGQVRVGQDFTVRVAKGEIEATVKKIRMEMKA